MSSILRLLPMEPVIETVLKYLDIPSISNLSEACTEFRDYINSNFSHIMSHHPEAIEYSPPIIKDIGVIESGYYFFNGKTLVLLTSCFTPQVSLCHREVNIENLCLEKPVQLTCYPNLISETRMFSIGCTSGDTNILEVFVFDRTNGKFIESHTGRWLVFHDGDEIILSLFQQEHLQFDDFEVLTATLIPTGPFPAACKKMINHFETNTFRYYNIAQHELLVSNRLLITEGSFILCLMLCHGTLTVAWKVNIEDTIRGNIEMLRITRIFSKTGTQLAQVILQVKTSNANHVKILSTTDGKICEATLFIPEKFTVHQAINFTGKPWVLIKNDEAAQMKAIDFEGSAQVEFSDFDAVFFSNAGAPTGYIQMYGYVNDSSASMYESHLPGGLIHLARLSNGSNITQGDVVTLRGLQSDHPVTYFYLGNNQYIFHDGWSHKLKLYDFNISDPKAFFLNVRTMLKDNVRCD